MCSDVVRCGYAKSRRHDRTDYRTTLRAVDGRLGCGDWVHYAETAQPKWAYGFSGFLGIYY